MAKLTDKQKKTIIAERVEGMSVRVLAEKYKVSPTTIRNTLKNDPKFAQKCAHKKEENAKSVLAFMDSIKGDVCKLVKQLLDALGDPDKIAEASINQIATVMGILIDKYTANEKLQPSDGVKNNLLEAINSCGEEGLDDLPEIQQTPENDAAVVEDGKISK